MVVEEACWMRSSQANQEEVAVVVVTEDEAACLPLFKVEGAVAMKEVVEDEVVFWRQFKVEVVVAAAEEEVEVVEGFWQQFRGVAGVEAARAIYVKIAHWNSLTEGLSMYRFWWIYAKTPKMCFVLKL